MSKISSTSVTVATGQTISAIVPASTLDPIERLTIQAPVAGGYSFATVQVTTDGTTWTALTVGGADVKVSAGKAISISAVVYVGLRLVTDVATTADATFSMALFNPYVV